MHVPGIISRHKLPVILVTIVALPVLVFILWATIALSYTYSSGDRAGYLQKISKRGWICKTWEGELQLVSLPGTSPEIFRFTTRSDSVAAELNKLSGEKVVVEYKQHKGVPGSCFGDTEYFVTGVRRVPGQP